MVSNNIDIQKARSLISTLTKWITILSGTALFGYAFYFQMYREGINYSLFAKTMGVFLLLMFIPILFDNNRFLKKVEKFGIAEKLNVLLGIGTNLLFIILSLASLNIFFSEDTFKLFTGVVYFIALIFFVELIFKRLILLSSLNFVVFTLVIVLGNDSSIGLILLISVLVLINLYHNKDIVKSLLNNNEEINDQQLHKLRFMMNLTFVAAIILICIEEYVFRGLFLHFISMLLSNEIGIPIYIGHVLGRIVLAVAIILLYLFNKQAKNGVDRIREKILLDTSKLVKK